MSSAFNINETPAGNTTALFKKKKKKACHIHSPLASTSQPHIVEHLKQTYISIKPRESNIHRFAQSRCVYFYIAERGRQTEEGREATSVLFTPLSNW